MDEKKPIDLDLKNASEIDFINYFSEDLTAIDEELEKSKKYSDLIDAEIKKLSEPGLTTKLNQHYLIEHITNAVQLQTQRQGLRKDRVAIKKLILDYANKTLDRKAKSDDKDSNNTELLASLKKLLEEEHKTPKKSSKSESLNLDSEIDEILDLNDKDGDQ